MAAAATMTTTTTDSPPSAGLARWTPSLTTNLLSSIINPFASSTTTTTDAAAPNDSTNVAAKPTATTASTNSLDARPILSALQSDPPTHHTASLSRSSSSSAMFAEPESRSSDGGSREGSVDGRRAKRTARPKTQFSVCHPPPESKARQKLHRRPRSLLQLHRLSTIARPAPALEVIPSANFSVRLTRAITRVFGTKHGLCPKDLVVLSAEKYTTEEAGEDGEAQDVLGIICSGRINGEDKSAGKVRIYTATGAEWEAYPAVNGGYEFFSTDEHGLGLTVRWVPRRKKDGSKSTTVSGKRRFNFSTISPNSRRHPVIASLSSTGLDINDSFKIPEPAAATPLSSPKFAPGADDEDEAAEDENDETNTCETDDKLREVIALTAIFVSFKEGWSPSFTYDDKEKDGGSPSKAGSTAPNSPPGSPIPFGFEKRSSIKSIGSGLIRRSSILSKSNRSSTASVPEVDEPEETPKRSMSISKTGRARANSSSTVLVQRAASNRRKNKTHATWRSDILPARAPLPETSREDLARGTGSAAIKTSSPLASTQIDVDEHLVTPAQPVSPAKTSEPIATEALPHSRKSVERLKVLKGHRESTTTTDTSASYSPKAKTGPRPIMTVKKSRWRRLLCGSQSSPG